MAMIPAGWSSHGCWVDGAHGRILQNGVAGGADMTIASCITNCQSAGYSIAGMEYSTECYCGNAIVNGGTQAQSDSDCNMACRGDGSEMCGGANRMNIYSNITGDLPEFSAPTARNTSLPGDWRYMGCSSDTPQPRVFPYQIDMPSNLTVENCLNLCSRFGFSGASMEYGQQCFCGDETDRVNAGATYLDESACNTPCSAEPESLCGGSNAMNYYQWEGLNNWGQGAGDSAGEYQYLVPGVVVPLITSVGINGKVLFTEKKGTSPAGNSSGAYELDLTLVNDFSAAWRTLDGLKTDVFCSAGLTLPDRGGRIINVGGWSGDSLYGLRFYWPDGSPGQPSTHDWQENHQEVALLDPRWYPTAMQLVNGSILVVGGENGSNGPPVPTLEVLPTPAGVTKSLYMDWLQRTDPNNLYPYLVVLPSGNIAVFYYNEARILDENTFETIRVLPNIPGAVNNFLAGRTYPLEGSAMILPQSAPYTEPLTVLICGGSTPYQGIALDNCVSIQPEVEGAEWTIERMPSKRVMTSMIALPDGTYIILNGANQGVAGFGLATDPNHMAILYDPSRPLNSRMTRMANTTIDRLYHSEGILLPDGRILVSGSDPEDTRYVQEYRVEVFIPPYLMGDRINNRPSFTFVNDDHADLEYDTTFDITVTGSVGKISLMAAVSHTHGNSMGQRTIFPEYSCNGGVCTIHTPPNGHTAGGPGWWMLFVIDSNGTPSEAKWVRIGGDPAGLGNWPNFPDFDLPGA